MTISFEPAGVNLFADRVSLNELIGRSPVLSRLDSLGRPAA